MEEVGFVLSTSSFVVLFAFMQFRLLTLLTMESILLDIKDLIYGRN